MAFLSGNEAIVEGALASGAKFFAGYPITPASTLMESWAKKAEEDKNLVFLQPEDEIAAIHQVIGSVFTGMTAFTATSGPGFSLMQEGLGLAFAYQAPIVVVDVMRSGPSTGGPTRAGQGEIIASRFGSHGDILPFVIYPTSVKECFMYTIKAFEIAWKHKMPVIILSDGNLANLREKFEARILRSKTSLKFKIQNSKFTGLTDRKKNTQKINEIKRIAEGNYRFYNLWGNKESDILMIGLGSVARALRIFEDKFQIFAPVRIWPFLEKDLIKVAGNKKRIIVVEMNEGQYCQEVERVLKREVEFVGISEEMIDLKNLKSRI